MNHLRRILQLHPAASAVTVVTILATVFAMYMPGLHSPVVTASFALVIALSLVGILIDPRPYSLCQMFCAFCLVFMGIAPLYLYTMGYSAWGVMPFAKSAYVRTNLLLAVCLIVFIFCAYFRRGQAQTHNSTPSEGITGTGRSDIFLVLLAAAATLIVLWYYRHSPQFLLRRFDSVMKHDGSSQVGTLLINVFMRSIPLLCLIVSLMQRRRSWWVVGLTALLSLVASFPTAIPRYQLATLLMPLCLMLIPLLRRPKMLTLCILFLFVSIFPMLNLARVQQYVAPHTFVGADFDAYQNLLAVMQADIVTGGKQLLGVLLFFVPRSIWPGKPVGSGFEVANDMNLIFSNISMPVFGEGYINFGIIGLFAFTIIVALIFRRLDERFALRRMSLSTLIYLIVLGESIYLLRGALMPAFASMCGLIAAALIVYLPARALGKGTHKSPSDNDT